MSRMMNDFHPVVLDGEGKIRNKLHDLHKKTRIEKRLLAAKAMEIGIYALEKKLKNDSFAIASDTKLSTNQ